MLTFECYKLELANMIVEANKKPSFQKELKDELEKFVAFEKQKFPSNEVLKIDMHCHDYNSNVPDELLGRILRVPETWLPTEKLLKTLKKNGTDVITITNHNNARSCFELINKGYDVLIGTEFSCTVPDFDIGIHVLTYGFTQKQELVLNKLRKNIYQFLQYAFANDIPTIWAHPLYHYAVKGTPPFDFFSKMALIFERFEILNGQRDTWQNMLVKTWLEQLKPEQIDADAEKFNIDLRLYCKNPYKKSFSGGSDSHMGIFSGQTGTYLHVPNLTERLKTEAASELALEAIRRGDMAPYGTHQNSEKLTVAFLDYVCQIAMYKEDPGLMRVLLHKGSTQDKILALFVSNAFSELRRHKVTMRFVELFHDCFMGKVPSKSKRILVPKVYKPVFDEAQKIAKAHELTGEEMVHELTDAISSISNKLNTILFDRLSEKINTLLNNDSFKNIELADVIEKLEIPSEIRTLTDTAGKKRWRGNKRMLSPNIADFLDGLPFPFLASTLILGANFTSSKVLYNSRDLLKTFSDKIGKLKHPKRMLWLTDTYTDKNGVSMVLQEMHKEIKARDLPIDILVCSNTIQPDDHLIVVKPMAEVALPFYEQQPIRFPNFNEIHHLFLENEYDRIMCSTEGIMGLVSLYLKNAYSVPAHFYIHTDWIMFAKKALKLDTQNIDRVRRMLRTFYKGFDKLIVLNTDHQKWLTSTEMGFDSKNVLLTAHWADEKFYPRVSSKRAIFDVDENDKVVLFAGRLSHEKGVLDLVEIYKNIAHEIPNLKVVFAGSGPAESELKEQIPNAKFLGWIDSAKLPEIYSAADLLILPSKFDTFSLVVLEALSCGLAVVAYKNKGPKDIIEHKVSGFLASSKKEMSSYILEYFNNSDSHKSFKTEAINRAKCYNKNAILNQFINDLELEEIHDYELVEA